MNIADLNPHIRYARIHHSHVHKGNTYSICYDCRIFYVKNASGHLIANGIKYNISSNAAIYLPPKTKYRFSLTTNEDFEIVVMDFDLVNTYSHLKSSLGTATEKNFEEEKVPAYELPELLSAPIVKAMPHIHRTLVECANNFLVKTDLYREVSSAHLKLCLLEFVRQNKNNTYSKLCKQVLSYIYENYTNHSLTNEEIAEKFNYHPYHLSRIIKQETGKSLHQQLMGHRISIAKNYLLTSEYTVEQISWKCGFSGVAYFIKLFRTHTGTTPKKYRQSHFHTEL